MGLNSKQRQIIEDKKQLSKAERDAQVKQYIESLYDPSKASSLSKIEVLALANAADKESQQQYSRWFESIQKSAGKRLYKYNINQTGANGILEDLRNFRNFRSTWDEFPNTSDSSVFGTQGRQAGTSPSKSFYMSAKDFLFSNSLSYNDSLFNKPEIQPIILNEFQPDVQIYWTSLVTNFFQGIFGLATKDKDTNAGKLASLAGKFFGSTLGADITKKAGSAAINWMTRYYSVNPEKLYDSTNAETKGLHNATSAPINWVKNMFDSGKWLNTYELPFFNNTYLEANQFDKWQTGRNGCSNAEKI